MSRNSTPTTTPPLTASAGPWSRPGSRRPEIEATAIAPAASPSKAGRRICALPEEEHRYGAEPRRQRGPGPRCDQHQHQAIRVCRVDGRGLEDTEHRQGND